MQDVSFVVGMLYFLPADRPNGRRASHERGGVGHVSPGRPIANNLHEVEAAVVIQNGVRVSARVEEALASGQLSLMIEAKNRFRQLNITTIPYQ